jgi:DNA-binding LytR/AlgR family response regulator
MQIKCLIIDDEPSSLSVLKNYINKVEFISLIQEFSNAIDAMNFLSKNHEIDLIFLDINMPKISGLSFYKSLQNPPLVIFTTAYSEYAVEAFNVNAVDYLLKPFSFDRFLTAVNKFIYIQSKAQKKEQIEPIFIKSDKKLHKVFPDAIFFIEAYGDYVKIHLENSFLLTYNTFKNVLSDLPPTFIKVHKSYAINIKKASSIEGNQVVINQQKIPIGNTYKADFLERFKNS